MEEAGLWIKALDSHLCDLRQFASLPPALVSPINGDNIGTNAKRLKKGLYKILGLKSSAF